MKLQLAATGGLDPLIFSTADLGLGQTLNLEVVAKEVVATLVGSIGLIAAVPVTTALAAVLALGEEPEPLAGAGHGRSH
ncbi:MAG: YibE/F family protein [Thermoleophilaceae bacterium]